MLKKKFKHFIAWLKIRIFHVWIHINFKPSFLKEEEFFYKKQAEQLKALKDQLEEKHRQQYAKEQKVFLYKKTLW